MLHRIHVHLILYRINTRTTQIGSLLNKERLIYIHRFFIHPDHHSLKVTIHRWQIVRMHQHFAARHIDLILQCQGHRLRWESIIQFPVISHDTLHLRCFSGRKRHHRIPFANDTGCNFTTESSEIQIRTKHILNRETEIRKIMVIINMNRFKEIEQRNPLVPRSTFRLIHHIIPIQCRKWNTVNVRNTQWSNKLLIVSHNLVKTLFRETHQVHLVDSQHHMLDS